MRVYDSSGDLCLWCVCVLCDVCVCCVIILCPCVQVRRAACSGVDDSSGDFERLTLATILRREKLLERVEGRGGCVLKMDIEW